MLTDNKENIKQQIDAMFDNGVEKLNEKKRLFSIIETNPEIILTDLFNPHVSQPYYEFALHVFGKHKELVANGLDYHDMQRYVSDLLVQYMKTLDSECNIELSKSNSYSSSIKFSFNQHQILRFSMYSHEFCDYRFFPDYDKELKNTNEEFKLKQNQLSEFRKYKENPRTIVKTIPDYFWYLFNKRKVITEINRKISSYETDIARCQEKITQIQDSQEKYETEKSSRDEKFAFWREKFIAWGYKELERRTLH